MADTINLADIVIGQEAICGDGLGRVAEVGTVFPHQFIKVDTYVKNRGCKWAPHNVKVLPMHLPMVVLDNPTMKAAPKAKPKEEPAPASCSTELQKANLVAALAQAADVQHVLMKLSTNWRNPEALWKALREIEAHVVFIQNVLETEVKKGEQSGKQESAARA